MDDLITAIITTSWITYGLLNFYQFEDDKDATSFHVLLTLHILLAPLVLFFRIIRGVFFKDSL